MPELPEVETIRKDLSASLLGHRVRSVQVFSLKSALPSAAFLIRNLTGRTVIEIRRRGKLLIFCLAPLKKTTAKTKINQAKLNKIKSDGFDYLLVHLRMTGQLIYLDKKVRLSGGHSLKDLENEPAKILPEEQWENSVGGFLPNKYTRIQLDFFGGAKLFFNDLRKFGYFRLVTKVQLEKILQAGYGPEPLTKDFTEENFKKMFSGRSLKIKALLLNQKIIAGLGNIYVDESLWQAGIDPERRVNKLKPTEIKKLYRAIKEIITRAVKYRGTTFNNYVDSFGRRGNFSRFLKVYHRQGQPCPKCGRNILRKKVAGRSSHYCPYCQK